jgi:hypothetical protein
MGQGDRAMSPYFRVLTDKGPVTIDLREIAVLGMLSDSLGYILKSGTTCSVSLTVFEKLDEAMQHWRNHLDRSSS